MSTTQTTISRLPLEEIDALIDQSEVLTQKMTELQDILSRIKDTYSTRITRMGGYKYLLNHQSNSLNELVCRVKDYDLHCSQLYATLKEAVHPCAEESITKAAETASLYSKSPTSHPPDKEEGSELLTPVASMDPPEPSHPTAHN